MKIGFMDAPKHTQIVTQCRSCPFAGITVHLPFTVTIVIAGQLAHAVADGCVLSMAAMISIRTEVL